MHTLLQRQLKKHFGAAGLPNEIEAFVRAVDDAYTQSDTDRHLLERSLDLTSQELLEANAVLRRDRAWLERRIQERTAELRALNESLRREVTERRLAEIAIRESEAKYSRLFERSRDGIFISTTGGRLIDINPAGVALFGYDSKEEMLALDVPKDMYLRGEDRDSYLAALREHGYVTGLELTFKHRDGSPIVAQVTATVDGEREREILGIVRDITEQRELEARLLHADRMEAVGRLAGGVAHDFNNLLTAILGYCDLLERSGPSAQHVAEIKHAAERGASLTTQLLAVSRRQVLRPRVVDLNETVAEIDGLLRRVIQEDVRLETRLAPELGAVRADPSQLEQVLLNLAVNARDAMPRGGVLRIRTENRFMGPSLRQRRLGLEPGPFAVLSVSDDGIGMAPDVRERIFEPFFTTKGQGSGTGLGLSTVYGIVQQSGGQIDVRSSPGRGSHFEIYLPRVAADIEGPAVEIAPEDRHGSAAETILVVEDERAVRALLSSVLEEQGYEVICAEHGVDAMHLARSFEGTIDALITDLVMPHMNGMELAEEIRPLYPDLKILLISGHTDHPEAIRETQRSERRMAFLQKPFSMAALRRALRGLLVKAPTPSAASS